MSRSRAGPSAACSALSTRARSGVENTISSTTTTTKKPASPVGHPPRSGGDGRQRQGRGNPARPRALENRWRLRPRDERLAVDAGPHVGAGQRHALAQVERRGQLGDGLAAGVNLERRGGRRQPRRERFFAGARACDREQLEQRPAAEQVEVIGVQVVGVHEAVTRLARPRPPILDARSPALVEVNRPRSEIALANDGVVPLHEPPEGDDRGGEPPIRERPAPAEDGDEHQHAKDGQAQVAQAFVTGDELLVSRAAQAAAVPRTPAPGPNRPVPGGRPNGRGLSRTWTRFIVIHSRRNNVIVRISITCHYKRYVAGQRLRLSTSIEQAVHAGRLPPGAMLPTVRDLSAVLKLSPATVAAAYRVLRTRGLTTGSGRQGTRVAARPPSPAAKRSGLVVPGLVDLATGNPDPSLLPPLQAAVRAITGDPRLYGDAAELPPLMQLSRGRVRSRRGSSAGHDDRQRGTRRNRAGPARTSEAGRRRRGGRPVVPCRPRSARGRRASIASHSVWMRRGRCRRPLTRRCGVRAR